MTICTTQPVEPDWIIGRQICVSFGCPGRKLVHKPGKSIASTSCPVRLARQNPASTRIWASHQRQLAPSSPSTSIGVMRFLLLATS
jgi:hypothetical protein